MGLFDVDGFDLISDKQDKKEKLPNNDNNQSTDTYNPLDSSISDDISPIIKYKVINHKYNLGKILTNLGYDIYHGNIYCPFHPDEMTGKPSARYHEDTDLLYCFSENKLYSAYHALKLLYGYDMDKLFYSIWITIPLELRHSLMDTYNHLDNGKDNSKYNKDTGLEDRKEPEYFKTWKYYEENALIRFKLKGVNYTQYKNALYKILLKMAHERDKAEKEELQRRETLQKSLNGLKS